MTRLADIHTELFPAARPIGPPDERGRAIAWVRVMKARVPAFDALDPGDVAVVAASALAVIAPTEDDLRPLVEAFVTTPVAGVLLVEGDPVTASGAGRLDELEARLSAAGVPGLRLGAGDPAAVERSVIGYVVGRAAELERQAGLLEADLAQRALAGDDIAALAAAIATFLARAVALEGPRGEVLTVHAPAEAPDAGAAVAAFAAGRDGAVALRTPLPSGGAIALLGSRPASDLEIAALGRAAGLLALELARAEAIRTAVGASRRGETLPSGGPPWVVVLARQRGDAAEDESPTARSEREALRRELRLLAPARRLALRGDVDSLEYRLVLAAGEAGATDLELVDRVAALLGRTVGLSRPFRTAADRATAEAEARATLDAALGLPDPPRVARADRLAAYRLMGSLHNLPDGRRLARAMLEPLLDSRPDVRREHLDTLRALLDRGGVGEAAAALGVHRNTIAYRVRRIESLTGWRLGDPDLRLPLAVALRIVQEDQV